MHTDNCRHYSNGSCVFSPEHCCFTRDISAILYLNGHAELPSLPAYTGGELFFVVRRVGDEHTTDAPVPPRCGRLVAFTAGVHNVHGVYNVEGALRF